MCEKESKIVNIGCNSQTCSPVNNIEVDYGHDLRQLFLLMFGVATLSPTCIESHPYSTYSSLLIHS